MEGSPGVGCVTPRAWAWVQVLQFCGPTLYEVRSEIILCLPIATIMGQSEQSLVTVEQRPRGPRAQGKRLEWWGQRLGGDTPDPPGAQGSTYVFTTWFKLFQHFSNWQDLLDLCIPSLPTSQFLHLPDIRAWGPWPRLPTSLKFLFSSLGRI